MLHTGMYAIGETCDKYILEVELRLSGIDAILGKRCTQVIHR